MILASRDPYGQYKQKHLSLLSKSNSNLFTKVLLDQAVEFNQFIQGSHYS